MFWRGEAALGEWRLPAPSDPAGFRASLDDEDLLIRWPRTYSHPSATVWADQIRDGLRKMLPFERADLEQPKNRPEIRFQFVRRGATHDVCLDYLDRNDVDPDFATRFAVYFKMQHRREGYGLEHVVPGGYLLRRVSDYLRLPALRELADRRVYRFDVHGRFGFNPLRANNDLRMRAVEMLSSAGYASFAGPLRRVGKKRYMEEIAESKVCVDLFGHGFLCARLVEYLSVGACIVSPRSPNRFPEPLVDGKHIAFVEPDLSNLVDVCKHYLAREDQRWEMVKESRAYFDAHLHRDRLVEHYVREMLSRT